MHEVVKPSTAAVGQVFTLAASTVWTATPPVHRSTVGRREILGWINETLDVHLNDISETASGAIACQLLDAMHPGVVRVAKVDFNAVTEYDSIANWRLFQAALNTLGIDNLKNVDIRQAVKPNLMELTHLLRWMKARYEALDAAGALPGYNAVRKRQLSKSGDIREPGCSFSPLLRSQSTGRLMRYSQDQEQEDADEAAPAEASVAAAPTPPPSTPNPPPRAEELAGVKDQKGGLSPLQAFARSAKAWRARLFLPKKQSSMTQPAIVAHPAHLAACPAVEVAA